MLTALEIIESEMLRTSEKLQELTILKKALEKAGNNISGGITVNGQTNLP